MILMKLLWSQLAWSTVISSQQLRRRWASRVYRQAVVLLAKLTSATTHLTIHISTIIMSENSCLWILWCRPDLCGFEHISVDNISIALARNKRASLFLTKTRMVLDQFFNDFSIAENVDEYTKQQMKIFNFALTMSPAPLGKSCVSSGGGPPHEANLSYDALSDPQKATTNLFLSNVTGIETLGLQLRRN